MPNNYPNIYEDEDGLLQAPQRDKNNYLLHIALFLITFITTTLAGAQWISGQPGPYQMSFILKGLPYSISIMFIISFHEFGHYFAAMYHKVKSDSALLYSFSANSYFSKLWNNGRCNKD
ncbi:MAG: hypothetical protein ACYDA4_02730 [Ignavibacteriaceae bacterium]